jgi:putative hydrolase
VHHIVAQAAQERMLPVVELHTHTVFSDGELVPAELARRAEMLGTQAIVFTDHVDGALLEVTVPRLAAFCAEYNRTVGIRCLPGAEVTHVRPALIAETVKRARDLGAVIVLVHGESLIEPVAPGTNRAAIDAGADILAHPGFLTEADAALAARKGVRLELSGKPGHSLTNGYLARVAGAAKAQVVFGSDAHHEGQLHTWARAEAILRGAGLSEEQALVVRDNARALVGEALARLT